MHDGGQAKEGEVWPGDSDHPALILGRGGATVVSEVSSKNLYQRLLRDLL